MSLYNIILNDNEVILESKNSMDELMDDITMIKKTFKKESKRLNFVIQKLEALGYKEIELTHIFL